MKLTKEEFARRTDTVEEYGGILPMTLAFYGLSIQHCSQCAIGAFNRYESYVESGSSPIYIASSIHEALGHSASLSRFFWNARDNKIHKIRAERLRQIFEMSEESPLGDRHLRNALEHFDEKLDHFLLENDAGYFFPTALVDSHELADDPVGKIFKLVDPDEGIFVILNNKYSFSDIRSEVERIDTIAKSLG